MTAATPTAVADRLGVCHVHARYSIGPEPSLLAGSLRTLELGSRVIKLWFRYPLSTAGYPLQEWPKAESLRAMAELPQMTEVFNLPFTSYILSTDATNTQSQGWGRRLSPDDLRREADELEDLSEYLATTFGSTGKTFVLQNWEGDWAARGGFDKNVPAKPDVLDAMVQRMRMRQEAVERGRRSAPDTVLHAPEVNLVLPESQAGRSVTEAVLPHVGCDLYSYSAWETTLDDGSRFVEGLERIRDAAGCRNDQVFLGEFGAPEQGFDPERLTAVVERTIDDGLAFGCRYLLYWAMFCNETRPVPNERDPFPDHPGFWLIRPDGTKAPHWQVMADKLA
jgi:hypothetical protein